jgi:tetratricopeptide (TPR) repeat protein
MPGRDPRLGSLGRQATALWVLLLLSGGCALQDWRFEKHRERAAGYVEAGEIDVALIELYSALGIRPDHADLNFQIAELESQRLDTAAALFFYEEAVRNDPDNVEAAVKLAMLLAADEPERSQELVDDAMLRHPGEPWTAIGVSDIALVQGDSFWALEAANEAVRVAPDFARAHWQLARVRLAMIRERSLEQRRIPTRMIEDAKRALQAYNLLAPDDGARTALEYARLMAFSTDHWDEAARWFGLALGAGRESGRAELEDYIARQALAFGRESDHARVQLAALTSLVRLHPDDLEAWRELARVSPRGSEAVFDELLTARPDDPAARILIVRARRDALGLAWAAQFLRAQAAAGVDPPVLLGFLADLLLGAGDQAGWEEASRQIVAQHPRHPRALLARAHLALVYPAETTAEAVAAEDAAGLLRQLVESEESPLALRLLAISESRLGNDDRALLAIERAQQLEPSLELGRLHAKLAHDAGQWERGFKLWLKIRGQTQLTDAEALMLARCAYRANASGLGRQVVMGLLARDEPPAAAAIELADHEPLDRRLLPKIMRALERELEAGTRDQRVLALLTAVDLDAGQRDRAITRLKRSLDHEIATGLRLLARARQGDLLQRQRGVAEAERQRAYIAGLARYVSTLALDTQELETLIAVLRAARESGMFSARAHIWLANLQLRIGRDRAARASFERALAGGVEDAWVKNELALLLARNGSQLERALQLARETASELGHADSLDTLGYVYLRSGDSEAALEHFHRAIELSGSEPRADFHYHLGLALADMGEAANAASAFDRALSLDPGLEAASEARAQLERSAHAGAEHEPS